MNHKFFRRSNFLTFRHPFFVAIFVEVQNHVLLRTGARAVLQLAGA